MTAHNEWSITVADSTPAPAASRCNPVLKTLVDRTGFNAEHSDDIIRGTNNQRSKQGNDLGRMSALEAGYSIKSPDVTLDHFYD